MAETVVFARTGGEIVIGSHDFGIYGGASFHISNLDSNGEAPFGDGNQVLDVSGNIHGGARVFGITLASFDASFAKTITVETHTCHRSTRKT